MMNHLFCFRFTSFPVNNLTRLSDVARTCLTFKVSLLVSTLIQQLSRHSATVYGPALLRTLRGSVISDLMSLPSDWIYFLRGSSFTQIYVTCIWIVVWTTLKSSTLICSLVLFVLRCNISVAVSMQNQIHHTVDISLHTPENKIKACQIFFHL